MTVLGRDRGRGSAGTSLPELVVALTVLAVGLVAVGQVFLASLRTAGSAGNRGRAVAIASREIEAATALPFDRLRLQPSGDVDPGPSPVVEGGATFTVTRTVEDVSASGEPIDRRRVGVVVAWHDEAGDHTIRQDTVVADREATATTTTTAAASTSSGLTAALNPDRPDSDVDLSWTQTGAPPGAWEIQHSLSSSFAPAVVDTTTQPGTLTSYRKTGLAPSTTYWFRLRPAGSSAGWLGPVSVTTAATTTSTCEVRSVSATPGTVLRVTPGNTLAEDVHVEVNATPACTILQLRYAPQSGKDPRTATLGRATGTNVWSWTIQRAADAWDAGSHTVEVIDGAGARKASLALEVCHRSGQRCA